MDDDPAGMAEPPESADPAQDALQKPKVRERIDHARERGVELEGRAVERFELERKRRTWVEICWPAWLRMRQRGGDPCSAEVWRTGSSCSCCQPRCSWWRSSARSRI